MTAQPNKQNANSTCPVTAKQETVRNNKTTKIMMNMNKNSKGGVSEGYG